MWDQCEISVGSVWYQCGLVWYDQCGIISVGSVLKNQCGISVCECGISLVSVWDQCWTSVGSIGMASVWDQCGISVESVWDQCGISVGSVWDQ